jgi:hypothetical protein
VVGGKGGRERLGEGGNLHVPSQRTTAPSLSAARGREESSALALGSGVGRGVERSEVSERSGGAFYSEGRLRWVPWAASSTNARARADVGRVSSW